MPVALIWGASGGMGASLVTLLKSKGWTIYAAARNSEAVSDDVELCVEFDANDPHSIEAALMRVAQETDGVDLVVYAAGGLTYDKLDAMSYEDWQSTMNSNVNGAFWAAQHSLNLLVQGGHMVFIGAYVDHLRLPKMGAYAAAKAALAELVSVLAKENRRQRFTVVRPGAVDTAFWEQVGFKKPADAKSPDQVAQAILAHYEAGESGDLNLD